MHRHQTHLRRSLRTCRETQPSARTETCWTGNVRELRRRTDGHGAGERRSIPAFARVGRAHVSNGVTRFSPLADDDARALARPLQKPAVVATESLSCASTHANAREPARCPPHPVDHPQDRQLRRRRCAGALLTCCGGEGTEPACGAGIGCGAGGVAERAGGGQAASQLRPRPRRQCRGVHTARRLRFVGTFHTHVLLPPGAALMTRGPGLARVSPPRVSPRQTHTHTSAGHTLSTT